MREGRLKSEWRLSTAGTPSTIFAPPRDSDFPGVSSSSSIVERSGKAALADNVAALARLRLMTKFPVGLGERDTSIELFGRPIAFPLAIAPTGVAGLC